MPRPISVVVSTWNCESTIQRCLRSIVDLDPQTIVVCDLGSTDGTAAIVTEDFTGAMLVQSRDAQSFAAARNAGLARSNSSFALFVDGDWVADCFSVDRLIQECMTHPDCALAVPRFVDTLGNDHIGHNIRRFPTAPALVAEFLMLHKVLGSDAVSKYRMLDFNHRSDRDVDHACGAFVLARGEALVSAKGYDQTLEGAWMEDVDLAQRLRARGWTSRFCAAASALHLGRETIRHFFIERHYDAYYRSVLRYTAKYLPDEYDLVRTSLLLGLASKAAFSYGLPATLRTTLLRNLKIYNSDETIQHYRQMYLRAIHTVRVMSTPC